MFICVEFWASKKKKFINLLFVRIHLLTMYIGNDVQYNEVFVNVHSEPKIYAVEG